MSVLHIPEKVKIRLWGQAAGRCQYEGCNKPLWLDSLTKAECNLNIPRYVDTFEEKEDVDIAVVQEGDSGYRSGAGKDAEGTEQISKGIGSLSERGSGKKEAVLSRQILHAGTSPRFI
jgi:type I restriction-modification system DNA methylase subunit